MSEQIKIIDFLYNSSVINLLIAVVIGKAFADFIQSTVSDIILPILNYIFNGSLNVSGLNINLDGSKINYGKSLGLFITLLISTFTLYYIFIRPFNKIIKDNDKKKDDEKDIQIIKNVLDIKEKIF